MTVDDRSRPDDALDETLEETFPASDAPANTVETGIRVAGEVRSAGGLVVRDNAAAQQFEVDLDGPLAFLKYERQHGALVLIHTEVPEAGQGRGVGGLLARTALQAARSEGLPVVVRCPFVRAYLQTHPDA
jgi:predicted GNAT family acetyltransferase